MKTYLVGWMFLLNKVQRYGGKWQAKMALHLTEDQITCVGNVLTTVAECLRAFGSRPVE